MPRPRHWTTRAVLAVAAAATIAAPAAGQPAPSLDPVPIDPTVDAVDPLAASQRINDPGIARFSPETRVWHQPIQAGWRPTDPAAAGRPYVYRAPGVTARMARPQHVALTGTGEILANAQPLHPDAYVDTIPADTVFSLVPEEGAAPPVADFAADDPRVDARVDGRFRLGQRRAPVEFLNATTAGRADLHELRLRFRAAEREEAERAAAAEAEAARSAPATQPAEPAHDTAADEPRDPGPDRLDRLEAALDAGH